MNLQYFKTALTGFRGLKAFDRVPRSQKQLVLYSEGAGYWTHFAPVVKSLGSISDQPIHYVTSDIFDPLLERPLPNMKSYFVGTGSARTIFFSTLNVDVILMTMPDLGTFHIKRSKFTKHYVYLHHSLVSTHMAYLPNAFDQFDAILCSGPHHVKEIRAREKLYKLPHKKLIEHGYGRLDALIEAGLTGAQKREMPCVLIAPSWGNGLLCGEIETVVEAMLSAGYKVIFRPHPITLSAFTKEIEKLSDKYASISAFIVDTDMSEHETLIQSDLMISDWSGAAIEFSFGLNKPVIYIDAPKKVRNPDYDVLALEPIEVSLRAASGCIVELSKLCDIGKVASSILAQRKEWQARLSVLAPEHVFNVKCSGEAAARYMLSLIQ